jgi:lipopolysaccharide export system protein LptA
MKFPTILAVLLATTSIASGAAAQLAVGSTSGVGIAADTQQLSPADCKTALRGQVEITQDQTRLRANSADIYGTKKGKACMTGDIDHIEATGDVFYVTLDQKVRGDKAVYEASSKTITVTGNVVVSSAEGVAQTNRLVMNTETKDTMMGDPQAGERVHAVIYPKQTSAPPKP